MTDDDAQTILLHFRGALGIPADHRLTVMSHEAGVLSVLQSDADGNYVTTHQLGSTSVGPLGGVTFTHTEAAELSPEQATLFDRIWGDWSAKIAQGSDDWRGHIKLSDADALPELFRFTHYNNIAGNVVEGMQPVWFALDDAVARLGYTFVLSHNDGGPAWLAVMPKARRF